MPRALEGVRVLDLTRLLPGAYCTQMLADLGAEVIKVEEPGRGDYGREEPPLINGESYYFLALNRNKRSVALNLKDDRQRSMFLEMADKADVVIENYRPGVAAKLGIDYQTLSQRNRRLVYCSISGYGQTGPRNQRAGHDINYIGLAGLLALNTDRTGTPLLPAELVADMAGSMYAAFGILAALRHRDQTGAGQHVDVSMFNCVLAWLTLPLSKFVAQGKIDRPDLLSTRGITPSYNVYRTRDGRFMTVGAVEDKFWYNFCHAIERPDLIPFKNVTYLENPFPIEEIQRVFLTRRQEEWEKIFAGIDACCEPVKSLSEVLEDPQALHRNSFTHVSHPVAGEVFQVTLPIVFSGTPPLIESAAPPLGRDTDRYCMEGRIDVR